MQNNIAIKIVIGKTAINKLRNKFLISNEMVENGDTLVYNKNNLVNISIQNNGVKSYESIDFIDVLRNLRLM